MKKTIFSLILGSVIATTTHAETEQPVSLDTIEQKFSYSQGLQIGKRMKIDFEDIDVNLLVKGIRDGLGEGEQLLKDEEVYQILVEQHRNQRQKQLEKIQAKAKENKAEGEAFLAENQNKEGVVTLASGLQYKILTEGKGIQPALTDTVKVHYKGTFINGEEFDSSHSRGQPAEFPVNRVIAGWTEALQLMPTGSKWQLFIPSDLAYKQGNGKIGPNQTLLFDVELLEVIQKGK